MEIDIQLLDTAVCTICGINAADITSPKQQRPIADARKIAIYIAHKHFKLSSLKLAKHYRKASHTGILGCYKAACNLYETDKNFRLLELKCRAEYARLLQVRKEMRRYSLHYRLRKKGYTIDTKSRTISIKNNKPNNAMKLLCNRHGYGIQLELF